jgi:hypothetical protein
MRLCMAFQKSKDFYLRKIQPVLSGATVPVLASPLGISET